MEPLTVLIVDDHPVVRQGLRFMLQAISSVEVVAEASTGIEAVDLTEKIRPAAVLMDLNLPDIDGIEATRRIKERVPETRVLIITVNDEELAVAEALQAGADGYLLKNASGDEIGQALELAVRGAVAIRSGLLQKALHAFRPLAAQAATPQRSAARGEGGECTPRELEVLRLIARGKTNKEIARDLIIAPATAKKHVERVVAKLGVSDRTEAAIVALKLGMLD